MTTYGTVDLVRVESNSVLQEFVQGIAKQALAGAFAIYLLTLIVLTKYAYPPDALITRYDFLLASAVLFQVALLVLRLETLREAGAIIAFHIIATSLEVFVTSDAIGAWNYPGEAVVAIGNVPLFTGFMYSSVGSYIARSWRIFEFEISYIPPIWMASALVVAAYVNFFTQHFWRDWSLVLIALSFVLFNRSLVTLQITRVRRRMPLLVWVLGVATLLWIAENIGTYSGIWLYPGQVDGWTVVSWTKLLAWFLFILFSFVLVMLVHRPRAAPRPAREAGADGG